jgi:hypothetical protein
VVLGTEQHQGLDRVGLEEARCLGQLTRPLRRLVQPERRPQLFRLGERLGHEVDVLGLECPGRGPESRTVERRDVAPALVRSVELGRQLVGLSALAPEVVAGHAPLARGGDGEPSRLVLVAQHRQDRVEQALARDEALEAQPEVLDHHSAVVPARRRAALVPQDVMDQRMQVARAGGHVVVVVGREPRLAEAAQVRDDHLEPRLRQRRDVAPPDPLRLGPPMDEQKGKPARARPDPRRLDAGPHLCPLQREGIGIVSHDRAG